MSAQTPQQCKNVDDSKWMYNDQDQTPCQVLSSSIRQFDTGFNLTWLDLSFTCPRGSNHTNSTRYLSNQLADYCCSSVSFSLFSSCWACQWDQPVQGYVRTTWGNYSSTCTSNSTEDVQVLAAMRVGTLSSGVQSALTAANIHIPNWAFLPVTSNSTWDELAAKSNASSLVSSSTSAGPNQLSNGAIAGISIGSFIVFCAFLFIFTVMCMRKKQRHRLEAFRHRSASIFGHKKRVVNMREKTVGARGREQQGTARMDLALEDDGLASPTSVKGGIVGAQRINSDLTMDISHDAMLPALLGNQTRRMDTPGSGVGGFPRGERPDSGGGVAARLQSNVRRSLARLGRLSQPGRTNSPQSHGLQQTTSNRHTHPMTQSTSDGNSPFAVPFFSSDQIQSVNASGRPLLQSSHSAPPSAWPTGSFDTNATHPLTQQQLHPQLSRNPSNPPPSSLQLSTANKATPMPLTKEALSLARVAQDGTLFVLGEPELHHGSGRNRGSGGANESRPVHPQQQMVRTVSIERNPAQMERHADLVPRRSDSLRRSQMQSQGQGQGQQQMGLVLHEAIMDGTVPRRKTPSRQKQRDDRGEGLSGPGPSTSRASPAVELGLGNAVASSSQPTASHRQPPSSLGVLKAPIARKAVPKSDSSVLATAGSAIGSNGEFSYADDDDDESIAALEIRHITGSATGTSGSTGGSSNGNGNGRGRGNGKKRGRESRDVRLSLAANTSLSSGNVGGVKSDGTRTPSPKVAPSAEWFDLFRRGTVPTVGGSRWPGIEGVSSGLATAEAKADLARTKTAPAPSTGAGGSMPSAPGPSKTGTAPLSSNQKRQAFQPNALAGPSMSTFERSRTQSATNADSAAALYRTPIAALYGSTSSSSLSALASTSKAPSGSSTSTVRRQLSAQNISEPTSALALTIPAPTSGTIATAQPSITRALPMVSPSTTHRPNPSQGLEPVSLPPKSTSYSTQPIMVSNMPQATTTFPQSQIQAQRSQPTAPLPVPPSITVPPTTLQQPRVAPAGARPVRRLPVPPQSPPG